jgi:hypothetical protein
VVEQTRADGDPSCRRFAALFQCGSPPISKVGKCTVLSYLLGRMMPFARRTCASRDAVIDRLIGLVPPEARCG